MSCLYSEGRSIGLLNSHTQNDRRLKSIRRTSPLCILLSSYQGMGIVDPQRRAEELQVLKYDLQKFCNEEELDHACKAIEYAAFYAYTNANMMDFRSTGISDPSRNYDTYVRYSRLRSAYFLRVPPTSSKPIPKKFKSRQCSRQCSIMATQYRPNHCQPNILSSFKFYRPGSGFQVLS